ncbi:peptidoglycan DD-metalloendopeptidase family protein [Nocardia sp. NPDC005746]|uniref:peptidoglycan DD-metalloendopeptidase family protein n=1 Tax=Nocardia sp. NPDC005746 TaxID=3157062 RepID=UPI003408065C
MSGKVMPLRTGTYRTGDGYRTPGRPDHRGQDFPADYGTPIYAVADGWVAHCGINDDPNGFGSWLVIDHQDEHGVDSVYGHMPPASFRVRFGDRVTAGQHIADVGSEGGSTGPHLHFEIWGPPGRFGGRDLNPLVWLSGAPSPAPTPPAPGGKPMGNQLDADVTILSPSDSGTRDPRACRLIVIHTNQGPEMGSVEGLLRYMADPAREVSYNLVVGADGRIGRSNDDNYVPWSAGSPANEIGLHLCFLGYSEQTRAEWLDAPAQFDAAARVLRDWSDRYGIPLVKLSGAEMRAGRSGVGGHADTVDAWHATDHTDPGPDFPWDVLLAKANRTTTTPNEETDDMTPEQAKQLADVHRELTQRYPSRSKYRHDDKPVDTLAGFVLNIDGREHEASVDVPTQLAALQRTLDELPAKIAAAIKAAQ